MLITTSTLIDWRKQWGGSDHNGVIADGAPIKKPLLEDLNDAKVTAGDSGSTGRFRVELRMHALNFFTQRRAATPNTQTNRSTNLFN